jgi:ATP-dependent Clp protease protease subunit
MTHNLGRRGAFLLLAGAAVPVLARAQDLPFAPHVTPPVVPPIASPAPPPATTATRPPIVATTAIDKTKSYYLFFDQTIDVASMRALRRQLANLVEAGVSEITLVLDSPGGLIDPMLITYSFILALPATINTHAQGFVQSAATLLFLAGQKRSADRNARFLFHPSTASVSGIMGEQQVRDRLTAFDVVAEVLAQIYHDRTSLPASEIERFTHETVIYTAEQALAAGVVQSVADLRIPGEGKAKIMFMD